MNQKKTGAYYTPQLLADYIIYRLFDEGEFHFNNGMQVLEPSVGGGIFLNALLNGNHYREKGLFKKKMPNLKVDAIEIEKAAAEATKKLVETYRLGNDLVNVINENYLNYFLNSNKKYDLIIGNPPYVRRRNMDKDMRNLCADVHIKAGLRDTSPKNLWTSFFAAAKDSLTDSGVIAFILPSDIMQVKYSHEIREILQRDFKRVEIFTLNWIYFDDIEQDVVILICTNQGRKLQPKFIHVNSLEDLEKPKHFEDHDSTQRLNFNKWTSYAISGEEYDFLNYVYKKLDPKLVRDYCDSGAGIVTAANDYYIVNEKTVEDFSLRDISKKTIKKSSSMFPAISVTEDDLQKRATEGAEIFFLDFPNEPKSKLPKSYLKYLKKGEDDGLNQRYKMLLRDNWYSVPSVWSSEAFFTKRSNIYPRIILNGANAYVTDAFYRIRMKKGYNEKNLSFSFFNTFTFIYSELMGRYYGGGVLELTPNEFKELPVPYIKETINQKHKKLDKMVRAGATLAELLNYSDTVILEKQHGISKQEIKKLRGIYRKLLIRRLKKDRIDI